MDCTNKENPNSAHRTWHFSIGKTSLFKEIANFVGAPFNFAVDFRCKEFDLKLHFFAGEPFEQSYH